VHPLGLYLNIYKQQHRPLRYLSRLRHETLPALRHWAQYRIYGYLAKRENRRLLKAREAFARTTAKTRHRVHHISLSHDGQNAQSEKDMSGDPPTSSAWNAGGSNDPNYSSTGRFATRLGNVWRGEGAEVGSRRARLRGLVDGIRDVYQSNYADVGNAFQDANSVSREAAAAPPDATITRSEDEEMIIFPSYSRRHLDVEADRQRNQDPNSTEGNSTSSTGAQAIQQHWDRFEQENPVVDVDVRGWLYAPHKGAMNRKQRIYIGIARQMAGLPSTASGTGTSPSSLSPQGSRSNSRGTSPHPMRQAVRDHNDRKEQRLVQQEADALYDKAEAESVKADRGEYSEALRRSQTSLSQSTIAPDDDYGMTMIEKRATWNHPSDMTSAELSVAHANLMRRLQPFYANNLTDTPVTAVFFNRDDDNITPATVSVYTNAYGQFALRASLSFVPTHVKIIAAEHLIATQEIKITESTGISVISDIDDTIKHTAMLSGVREAFRNAFLRGLDDLMIDGVKDWYNKLASIGVSFHYVSNSPWQLYPVLSQFFTAVGLPPGSLHLKQYTGMLQGIFEPVAERKKSTLDRIARDFPQRRFILIGDSGEADLEVYTDFVHENPGRVLGIFIRDVTTPVSQGFFDSNVIRSSAGTPKTGSLGRAEEDDIELKKAIEASLREYEAEESKRNRAPAPPPRRQKPLESHSTEDLISFSDDEPPSKLTKTTSTQSSPPEPGPSDRGPRRSSGPTKKTAPPPPRKPQSLRSQSTTSKASSSDVTEGGSKKPIPPLPKRQSSTSTTYSNAISPRRDRSPSTVQDSNGDGYAATARAKLSSIYNAVPPAPWNENQQGNSRPEANRSSSSNSSRPHRAFDDDDGPPPPPPRRTLTSYPAAAANYASNRVNSVSSTISSYYTGESADATGGPGRMPTTNTSNLTRAQINRIEMWKRRWATAEHVLREKGVFLKSWRVGDDAMEDSVRLVQKEMDRLRQLGDQEEAAEHRSSRPY
jgi:phosphatidate phosphatase APP1